jgi:hypothetical protein
VILVLHFSCFRHSKSSDGLLAGSKVAGKGWLEASCDVVISGLGWFSVTGCGPCKIRVVAPKGPNTRKRRLGMCFCGAIRSSLIGHLVSCAGVLVIQRDPLMPFEAKSTVGKVTGGRIIKNFKGRRTLG